jgi:hypothetical protein
MAARWSIHVDNVEPILFKCPECDRRLRSPAAAAGQAIRCPNKKCGVVLTVPRRVSKVQRRRRAGLFFAIGIAAASLSWLGVELVRCWPDAHQAPTLRASVGMMTPNELPKHLASAPPTSGKTPGTDRSATPLSPSAASTDSTFRSKAHGLDQSWAILSEATTRRYYRGNIPSDLGRSLAISRLPELVRLAGPEQTKAAIGAMDIIGRLEVAEAQRAMAELAPEEERERLNKSIIYAFLDPDHADHVYYEHMSSTLDKVNKWVIANQKAVMKVARLQDHWDEAVLPAIIAAAGPETDKPVIEVETERVRASLFFSAKNVSGKTLTNCTLKFVVDEGVARMFLGMCEFRMMPFLKHASDIPTKGKGLVIVALANQVLHVRIFNTDGKMVVDTNEKQVPERARAIDDLRKQLATLDGLNNIPKSEKYRAAAAVALLIGGNLEGLNGPFQLSWFVREWPAGTVIYPDSVISYHCNQVGEDRPIPEILAVEYQVWSDQHRTRKLAAKLVEPYTIYNPFTQGIFRKGAQYIGVSETTRTTIRFKGIMRTDPKRGSVVGADIRTEPLDGTHTPVTQRHYSWWKPNLIQPSILRLELTPPFKTIGREDTLTFRWTGADGRFMLDGTVLTAVPSGPENEVPLEPSLTGDRSSGSDNPKNAPQDEVPSAPTASSNSKQIPARKATDPAARAAMILKRADNLEFIGNYDAAVEYYRQIKSEFPGSPQAKTAAERLRAITGK